MKTERAYCQACTSIDTCQYTAMGAKGFQPIWEEWDFHYPVVRECRHRKVWAKQVASDRAFGSAGLPTEFRQLTLDTLPVTNDNIDVLTAFEEALTGACDSLLLIGPSRFKKSALVTAFANSCLSRGDAVKYFSVTELLILLRYNNLNYETNLDLVLNVPVLIIEGIGTERANEYSREQLELVLCKRRREHRVTVMTSSLDARAIVDRYGHAPALEEELNLFRKNHIK